MANDLTAINRATDPGIVIDDRLLHAGGASNSFLFVPCTPRSFLFFPILPPGSEKRALWVGPMILDERYPFPF